MTQPDAPIIPSEYNILVRRVTCYNCGAVEVHSDFMAVSYIRARHHTGTPVRHSMKCDGAEYNLPIHRINVPAVSTPYCAACPNDKLTLCHLPPPPSEGALTDLPEPVLKTTRKPTAPPRRKPTIEELA